MSVSFSVFLIAGLATIAGTLISVRREHIRVEYSVGWLAFGALLSGLALFPKLITGVSARLGLDPQVWFLMIGVILISALVFEMSRVVSRLRDENVLLAQRVAILEFCIQRKLNEQNGDKGT
jgi:hypothetical protein